MRCHFEVYLFVLFDGLSFDIQFRYVLRFHGLHHDLECSGRQVASLDVSLDICCSLGQADVMTESGVELLHPGDL